MRIIVLVACLLLSGCAGVTGENDFNKALTRLEQLLVLEDWQQIKEQAGKIDTLYEKAKWKLQLLGDEDEYESLQESIAHLQTAARIQEKADCEKELTTIKTYIKQIYNL